VAALIQQAISGVLTASGYRDAVKVLLIETVHVPVNGQ
jgi:hypothetical protein